MALAEGRPDEAVGRAEDAVAAARAVHAFDVLAESLGLLGLATDDPGVARGPSPRPTRSGRRAAPYRGAARLEVLLGLTGHDADGAARSRARQASRQLQRMGILRLNGTPLSEDPAGLPVAIAGARRVRGQGRRRAVPLTALAVAAGPNAGEDPGRPARPAGHPRPLASCSGPTTTRRGPATGSRCCCPSSAGCWTRPRPGRRPLLAADLHRASGWTCATSTSTPTALLRDAAHAAELMAAGEHDRAREILTDVDARYRGDAFEDEPYEEWADGFREEARAAWLRSLRRLASLHSREGRVADAQVLLVRLLGADPYDEPVHRLLVGRSPGPAGTARRGVPSPAGPHAMAAIAAPPPDPGVLVASALTPR